MKLLVWVELIVLGIMKLRELKIWIWILGEGIRDSSRTGGGGGGTRRSNEGPEGTG